MSHQDADAVSIKTFVHTEEDQFSRCTIIIDCVSSALPYRIALLTDVSHLQHLTRMKNYVML